MIKVFYGENREAAVKAAREFLGSDYEVVEGAEIEAAALYDIFLGVTLFATERKILVRDLLANKAACEKLGEFLETEHKVALLEMKVDKRSNAYKALKDKVEFVECKMPRNLQDGVVFDVYKVAKRDGRRAVEMLETIKMGQDPIMFEGLMVSQALKDFAARPGAREKRVLKELAKLDMNLKLSGMEPWTLIEAFLTRLAGK